MKDLSMAAADFDEIPVVTIGALSGGWPDAAAGIADEITQACVTAGFFYVADHGVPAALVEEMLDQAAWFFALPADERHALDVASSPNFRGYVPMGLVGPGVPPRMLEAFQVMLELGLDDPDVRAGNVMYGPNRWPAGAPAFRDTLGRYYDQMQQLADRLLRAFAIGLGLDAAFFGSSFRKPLTQLRLLHYPSQPIDDGDDVLGVEAHTDTGAFTVLLQDTNGGLEVRNRSGRWIAATPIPGTFVVNVADMMQRWTNGRFVSTRHRVANRSGHDRISIPFFVNPDYDAVVARLPQCVDAAHPPAYDALVCGPYVEAAYRAAWPLLNRERSR
jgi:isopenicillin N synthase-like dioxygenase